MVIDFSVENFRSIKELQTLSLEARSVQPRYHWLEDNVVSVSERQNVLRSKVVYGANASGKSNLVMALSFFNIAVVLSANAETDVMAEIEPFAFDASCLNEPSFFEMRLFCGTTLYRYGFLASAKEGVVAEWLFGTPGKKEVMYFTRDEEGLQVSGAHLKSVQKLLAALGDHKKLVRKNNLLLSALARLENSDILEVYQGIASIRITNGAIATNLDDHTISEILKPEKANKVKDFLLKAGIDIGDFRFTVGRQSLVGEPISKTTLLGETIYADRPFNLYVRPKLLSEENDFGFRAESHLSKGTIKMIQLSGGVMAAIEKGDCIVIDEFEARLHTKLSRAIIELFNDPETNPNKAQIVVATHDTNLLDPKLMRRDQISFVEKDEKGASRVYSLADIKGVRNDASYEKDYLSGRYGAIPSITNL